MREVVKGAPIEKLERLLSEIFRTLVLKPIAKKSLKAEMRQFFDAR